MKEVRYCKHCKKLVWVNEMKISFEVKPRRLQQIPNGYFTVTKYHMKGDIMIIDAGYWNGMEE